MRWRSLLGVLGLLAVLTILINLRLPLADQIKSTLSEGFVPFIEFSTRVQGSVELLISRFKAYSELQTENTQLRQQLGELSARVAQVSELERENREFRLMLEFKNRSELKLLPAKIVGRDPSSWWNTVLIDRGSADGITRDMPVLTVEGLVGKTLDVTRHNTRVLLLVDENCKVPGWLHKSGHYGIVQGNILAGGSEAQCRMTFVDRTAQIKPNDRVYTSGLGEVFPKGILIGTVNLAVKAKGPGKNVLYQDIFITPVVDLAQIDEVFIGVGVKVGSEGKFPLKARK